MRSKTKTKILKIIAFLAFLLVLAPAKISIVGNGFNKALGISLNSAHAVPNGFNICTADPKDPTHNLSNCINNIYVFAIGLGGFVAVFMFVWAGYMYITGGDERITKAKSIFGSTFAGLLLLFGVYALLNTINPSLTQLNGVIVPQVSCTNDPKNGQYGCQIVYPTGPAIGLGGVGGSAGSGSCGPVTDPNSPAAVSNLQKTCFGSNATQASSIAQGESGGLPNVHSGSDICADGSPASWGLFQINITAHDLPGLNCTAAFSGGAYTAKNHSCRVINQDLFNQCVAAAKDPDINIKFACELSGNGTHWGQWGANNACHFPN